MNPANFHHMLNTCFQLALPTIPFYPSLEALETGKQMSCQL